MKRLIGLFGVLAVGVLLTTATLKPREANAVDAKLLAVPTSLEFNGIDPNKISHVGVDVKRGWVDHENFELDIEITGINGGIRFHGREVVAMSAAEVFNYDRDVAHILIPWNDQDANHVGENYTVCIQVLVNGKPLGERICIDGFFIG